MAQRRLKVQPGVPAHYHVYTKVVQDLFFLISEEEKKHFMDLLRLLSQTFFVEILAFQVMDNHFHIVLKIETPEDISMEELEARFKNLYPDREFNPNRASYYVERWGNLSMFMKTLNERFAVYYNRKHGTSGHFWGTRFKSVILADEEAVLSCMAYVELNAVRASMVKRPSDYQYGSLGYVLDGNKDNLVSVLEIKNLLQGLSVGQIEESVREALGASLSYLPDDQQKAYIKYMAFVQMKMEEGFLHKIKTFGTSSPYRSTL